MAQQRKTDYTVKSIDSAIDLLQVFGRPPHEFGVSELAATLNMSRNQVFRIVKTLESRGFLTRNGQKYAFGISLVSLVRKSAPAHDIIRNAARSVMRETTDRTGETSYLLVPVAGGRAMCAEVVESSALIRSVPPQGEDVSLNLGAASKVLLTFAEPEERQWVFTHALETGTAYQLDENALREQIKQIALRHYAVTREEQAVTVDAVGAPIWDQSGQVVAALGMVGPTSRMRARLDSDLPMITLDAARRISARLGGDPDILPHADLSDLPA